MGRLRREALVVGPLGGGVSDTTAPTCTITCAQSSPTMAATLNFTFTFSETVTGFAVGDITVGNGSAGNFAGSGAVYTADITPSDTNVTVDVGAGVCQDAAGNNNTAATQFAITSLLLDTFTRADGAPGYSWVHTSGKWAIATNAAVGTPGLSATVNANPGFDADTNWLKTNGDWTIGSGTGNKAAGTGTQDIYQNGIVAAGGWYRCDWTISTFSAGQFFAKVGAVQSGLARASAASFVDVIRASIANATGIAAGATGAGSIDNVTFKLVTLADQFCTRDFGQANIDISVPVTIASGQRTQTGVVVRLDSTTSPANFIIGYHNGVNAILDKCVGGTYTNLISSAAAYADGRVLRVVASGTTIQLYYNGVQIGTNQTVSDAGIASNTKHGLFSTYGGNSIAGFTAANP